MVQEFKFRISRIKLGDRYGICLILILSLQHNCLSERQLKNGTDSNTTLATTDSHHQGFTVSNNSSLSRSLVDSSKNQTSTESASIIIKKSTGRRSVHKRRRRIKPREESKTPSPFDLAVSDELMKEASIDTLSSQYGDNEYLDDTILDTYEDPAPSSTMDLNPVAPQEPRKDNEIEHIVRSQLDFGASNWVTLKPEQYPLSPTFNESIQGLDWPSYLANYSKTHSDSPDSAVLNSANLFYPNHNYKFDNNSTNPFRQYVSSAKYLDLMKSDNGYLSNSDSVTASSEESNRYDQLPLATESHFGTVIASTPEPSLNRNNHSGFNPNMHYKYSARNLPPKTGKNATGRPRWYNPNLDLSRLVPRNNNSGEASHHQQKQPMVQTFNSSELVQKQEPIINQSELESKFRMTEARVSQKNVEPATSLSLNNLPHTYDLHIETSQQENATNSSGNEGENFQKQVKGYQLRPTIISNGPPQPPWLMRNHFSSSPVESFTKTTTTDHHLRGEANNQNEESESKTNSSLPSNNSPSAGPSDKLLWDSSRDHSDEPKSSSPRLTTVIIPTIRAQTFTPAPPAILLPTTSTEVPNHMKANSAASMRAIGVRLARRPSHHHHHHSHIHNIRPAVISVPSRPKFRDYEGLVAAAAAAAAATATATAAATASASNNHQATYRHRQQVLARPLFGGIVGGHGHGLALPSAYSYRLNIGPAGAHNIGPIFVRHPPVTIPIGGTLSSMNRPQQQQQLNNKPPLQTIQATLSATYHKSLLGHILDSANRAVKQVAGNTVGRLNLHPPPALAENLFPSGRVYAAKNNRGNKLPGIRDLFEAAHDADSGPNAVANSDPYMDSLRMTDEKEMTPIGLKVGSHPTVPLKSLNVPPMNSLEETGNPLDFEGPKEQVIFAPLSDHSNLLYPILSSQLDPIASLIEESEDNSFSPMGQTSSSSQKYYQAPLWTPEMETKNKRIPLNKHYNRTSPSSKHAPSYSQQVYPQHRPRRPSQTILVEEKKGLSRLNSSFANNQEEQQMRYAVAHYIGETDPVLYSTQKGSSVQSGKKLVYEIVEDSNNNNPNNQLQEQSNQASPIDFIPIKDSEASQSSVNVDKMPHKSQPLGQVYANLNGQTFVLSNLDKQTLLSGAPIEITGGQPDPETEAAILATSASMSDDYRHGASHSKPQQHLIQFTTTGLMNPHTDPLHQAIQAAASSIKPHLTAASDLINYHKLRLINHYLQYHMNDGHDGHEFGPHSNSARLASSGGPRAHLLLHYWPIVLALLPIMIIVSIMVQLVLAAPLVMFAMTTLTAARFVGAIFGPLFGREELAHGDLIGAATKSAAESLLAGSTFQQTPNQLTNSSSMGGGTARIGNSNFIQSIIKMHNNSNFGPVKTTKALPVPKATDGSTTTSAPKIVSHRRKRKRRHLEQHQTTEFSFIKELERFVDSLELTTRG